MTMRIGRLVLPDPEEWRPGREEVRIAGLISEPGELDYPTLVAMADAVTATAGNPDEPDVPVDFAEGPGFYTVEDMQADPDAVGLAAGWVAYEARLRPVDPVRRPQIISAMTQNVRDNDNGVTAPYPMAAVPAEVDAFSWLPTASAVQEVRATAPGPAGGGVLYRRAASGTGQTTARYWVAPEAWHQGSCHVVRRPSPSRKAVPFVGRGTLEAPWRAGNGLVEFWILPNGQLSVRWWKPGGGWTAPWKYAIGLAGGFHFAGFVAAEVTEMTAQKVTVRAQGYRPSGDAVLGRTTLWLTIKRGSRTIEGTVDTDAVPGHRITPQPASGVSVATTDATDHAWLTTAPTDSGGLHYVITAADNFGVNTTTGAITPSDSRLTWSWGIGAYFDGAAGDSGSRDATMRDWYATRSEQVQIG